MVRSAQGIFEKKEQAFRDERRSFRVWFKETASRRIASLENIRPEPAILI